MAKSGTANDQLNDQQQKILSGKKAPNRLIVDEAINDDNSAVTIHPNTLEKL